VWIKITPSTDLPTVFFQGPSWLDLNLDGAVGDAVKVNASFSANGAWEASLA
jgi:hypothetical protein